MDTTEQVYDLIKQWCNACDQHRANEALRQIAIVTECLADIPERLNEKQSKSVVQWLQINYPNAYLWAISQHWVGHPATVWGMGFYNSRVVMPNIAL